MSASRMRAVVAGLLLAVGPVERSLADFIPLTVGRLDYSEQVAIPTVDISEWGTSPLLAESIQVSYFGAFGSASNTAGSGQVPASTLAVANANQTGLHVGASTDVTFDARLIRLARVHDLADE